MARRQRRDAGPPGGAARGQRLAGGAGGEPRPPPVGRQPLQGDLRLRPRRSRRSTISSSPPTRGRRRRWSSTLAAAARQRFDEAAAHDQRRRPRRARCAPTTAAPTPSVIRRAYEFSARRAQGAEAAVGRAVLRPPGRGRQPHRRPQARRAEHRHRPAARHRRGHADHARRRSRREFGDEIAALVDGVTKISQINFTSREEKQAENFRKMILAMARDIRVILVKLADRTAQHAHARSTCRPSGSATSPRRRSTSTRRSPTGSASPGSRASSRTTRCATCTPRSTTSSSATSRRRRRSASKYINEVSAVLAQASSTEAGIEAEVTGPAEALLLDLPEDAGAEPALRPDLRPGGLPRPRRHAAPSATRRSASSTPTGSRYRGASRTTSRCPRRTCTSRCTPP